MRHEPAILVLEDGRMMRGSAYGARGTTFGEAVFATGMTGYQETLTDPSYHRQVVIMTAPHIGNTGVNGEDPESRRIWVAGYVVRDPSRVSSNWRATGSLEEDLADQGVVGISGVDTRALTRHLRERGAMRVGIFSGAAAQRMESELLAEVRRVARVQAHPGRRCAPGGRQGQGRAPGARAQHGDARGGHEPLRLIGRPGPVADAARTWPGS